MDRRRLLCFVCLCTGIGELTLAKAAEDARSSTTLVGEREGAATAGRLQAARDLEAKKEWADAVEEYMSILANAGDELVPISNRHFMQARWRCHRQLALMQGEALALYRKRAVAQAKKWYEAAAAERDARQLRRVVDEAFCSRPAEAALDLLGELAFEKGNTVEAERWWRMLARPASQAVPVKPTELDLVYPDPKGDVARYRAKQLLARLFGGDPSFAEELKSFRALHPKAEGWLAGQKGNFGDILQQLSKQTDWKETVLPAAAWATFAGDAMRNRILPAPPDRNWLSRLCEEEPARFDLSKHKLIKPDGTSPPPKTKVVSASEDAQTLAFFPVIFDNKVAVADTNGVTVYDPLTGAVHDWTVEQGAQGEGGRETKLPAPADLRYTLTAAGRRLYVRIGAPAIDPSKKEAQQSRLVCLEWDPQDNQLRERWQVAAKALDKAHIIFEGSPLVDGDRAFAAFTRLADRANTGIVCLDASTGAVRWRQEVCESSMDLKQPRYRHHLLTLAGTQLIYCSHTGLIAALDAATGKRLWAVRYQSAGDSSPRDLTPCLFDGSRLFVAPADCKKILCLDSATGLTFWERDNIEVVHLLGVADGRLIFNTSRGIRALHATTGLDEWSVPAIAERHYTYGRGLIFGDVVLYPTVDGVKVLNLQDGQPTDRLNVPNGRLNATHGHLAYADGILAVTDRGELTVFVAPALLKQQRKEDARDQPDSAMAHYRLALAQTDAGDVEEALQEWQRVESLAKPQDRWQSRPLRECAQEQRHGLMLHAAEMKQAARKWDEAEAYLNRASDEEFSVPLRFRALAQAAAWWEDRNEPLRAINAWRVLDREPVLRSLTFVDSRGNPQVADTWAGWRIESLLGGRLPREPWPTVRAEIPPVLQLPWRRGSETRLENCERPLPTEGTCEPGYESDCSAIGRTLICRNAINGKWNRTLLWEPCWIGTDDNSLFAGGTSGVCELTINQGTRSWTYTAPPFDPFQATSDKAPALSAFHLSDHRLYFRTLYFLQGESRFFAMDPATGRVLWTRWAPDARLGLPYPAGHFFPKFQADRKRVALQTYAGKWWLLDAADGRLIHTGETGREPWAQAPVVLDRRRWCVATDPQRVLMFDPETGKELWQHEVPGKTTSSGVPPLVLTDGNNLGLLVARNYGCSLQRLDPSTGKAMWNRERMVSTDPLALEEITLDRAAFYVAAKNMLSAYALGNGRLLWERSLAGPAGNWRVELYRDQLVVYPAEARAVDFQVRTPFGALECTLAAFAQDPTQQGYPVIFADPKTGQLEQRLNFTVPATRLRVRVKPDAAGLEARFRPVPPPSPTGVRFAGDAATVVLPDRLCRLAARKTD